MSGETPLRASRVFQVAYSIVMMLFLSGCGAIWDSIYPPEDPREHIAFHLGSDKPQPGWKLYAGSGGMPDIYVQPQALMTGGSIRQADPLADRQGRYYVGVSVTEQAASRLGMATERVSRGYLLVIVEKGKLAGAMPLQEPITGTQFAIPVKSVQDAVSLAKVLSPGQGSRLSRE